MSLWELMHKDCLNQWYAVQVLTQRYTHQLEPFLQQRTTLALDGVFSTTKRHCGKTVTPNMSLLNSVKTHDSQVQNRMNEYRHQWKIYVEATPLWATTESSRELTTMAESLKQVTMSQSNKYYMRVNFEKRSTEVLSKYQHECKTQMLISVQHVFSKVPYQNGKGSINLLSNKLAQHSIHSRSFSLARKVTTLIPISDTTPE